MRSRARALQVAAALALAAAAFGCSGDDTTEPTQQPPGAVTGVTTTVNSPTSITVTWAAVTGATSYVVQRAEGASGGTFADVATPTGTSFADTGLKGGTTYRYKVAAANAAGTGSFSTEAAGTTMTAGPKVATVTGNITSSRTFSSDTLYVLRGFVKVTNGATLTIQPGTKIVGDTTAAGSSLWITRGATINAVGTAQSPIVFTSQRAPGNRAPGDWGGLVIVGNALDNRCVTGGVCTLFTEGPQGTGQDVGENYGGGTDPNDNSGTLKYVRIEFAGFAVLKDQELNSVSSYVVGSGTQYDYVETIAGLDDAFEFFGGGAQLRHLISFETGDDHFDWSEGFQGKGQWMIALQTTVIQPRAGAGFVSTDPRGFEGDGCEIDKAGCTGFGIAPYSQPFFANFTIIGPGPGVFTPTDGNGMVVRRGSGGTFVNGVVARWPGFAISVRDSASLKELERDSLIVRNLVFAENGANFEPAGTNFGQKDRFANASITEATGAATSLFVNLPAAKAVPDIATIDFTPAAGGALASGGLTTFPAVIQARAGNFFGGSITPTSYVGAVDPAGGTNGKWWQGWTAYYTK